MLMHNPYVGKKEIMFISYDEVIRSPYPLLLKELSEKFRHVFDGFINFDTIDGMDEKALLFHCLQRTTKNVFEDIALKEFDYEKALKEAKDKFFDLYKKSELLKIGTSVPLLAGQKFTEKIYIHSEIYDIRIHRDIQETFHNMEMVTYITGDMATVLDNIKGITSFIVNDFDMVPVIFEKGCADETNIIIAQYGFNHCLTEEGALELKHYDYPEDIKYKISMFAPFDITPEHLITFARG